MREASINVTKAQPVSLNYLNNRPQSINGCPRGLELLFNTDQVVIKLTQTRLKGWDNKVTYTICTKSGEQIYYAVEESLRGSPGCCCFSFKIHILDNFNEEIATFSRQFKYCSGCCWLISCFHDCAHELSIESPVAELPIGYIKQNPSPCRPNYDVLDENRNSVLNIKGPYCVVHGGPFENEFEVNDSETKNRIGTILKKATSVSAYTMTNYISFPTNLSVKSKLSLIASLFLIVI